MNKKISFQGVEGAYSHLAVQEFFPGAEPLPCKTFEIALNEAEIGNVDYAMIPIENSAAGRVADIHRLIPKSNLHINFEHFQKVEHKLLIHPDSKIENIKNIISHEQALAQCSDKIQKLDLEILIGADTAGSAKDLAKGKDKSIAAIASELAARIYNLKILKKNIEDNKGNVTRFLIMGSKASHPEFKKKNYITSCIFKVKNKPAALYKCLGGFATNNVNLSKLESFSYQYSFEQYLFICDMYGHIEDTKIQKSLEELAFHTVSLDILGVYEASPFRKIK